MSDTHSIDSGQFRLLQWILSGLISLVILLLLFDVQDASRVLESIAESWKPPVLSAFVFSLVGNLVFSSWQWRVAFDQIGIRTTPGEHAYVKTAIYALRSIPPIRHGHVGREIYMSRVHNVSRDHTRTAVALVAWTNVVVMLAMTWIACLLAGSPFVALMAFIGFAACLVGGPLFRNAVVRGDFERVPKDHWKRALARYVPVVRLPAAAFWSIFLYGVFIVLTRVFAGALIASSLGIALSWRVLFGALVPTILLASLPISYFGFGVRELALIVFLAGAARAPSIFAMGLMFSLIDQIPVIVPGVVTMVPFLYACRFDDWPVRRMV